MICPTCDAPTARLLIYAQGRGCPSCLGLSQTGGAKVDGTLTRSSDRIREQQRQFEGDMLPPHEFDPVTRDLKPSEAFMKLHPDKITRSYTQAELEKAGHSKAGELFAADKKARAAHATDAAGGISYRKSTP